MTPLAFSDATTISVSVIVAVVLIVLLVILRVVFRREPSPPTWLRIRLGVFLERDPSRCDTDDEDRPVG